MDGARNFAIQRFAKDLLESIDNFDRALLAVPKEKLSAERNEENKELLDLVDGLKMTEKTLMSTLQKHGLERFDPSEQVDGKPQKFDPNMHEATFMAPVPHLEDGDVMHTQSKGFLLNGRIVRVSFAIILYSYCDCFLTWVCFYRPPRSASSRTPKSPPPIHNASPSIHFPSSTSLSFCTIYHTSRSR